KNIWTAPLPPETELSRQMTTSTTSIDIMGLQAAYANLHTDQERDYFMQRYHDVISSFGGKTSYDADNRPLLVMRSNLWASRSEERRVGKECRSRWWPFLYKKRRKANDSHAYCSQYFCVPEYGTANGLLQFHAVHFMLTLPTVSVDPNICRGLLNRGQLTSFKY